MKKKILSLVLAICLIIPCVLFMHSCVFDTFHLSISLNHSDAHYTQTYKEANKLSSDVETKNIYLKDYDKLLINIPQKEDLVAPEGKVFAGWYLNQECDPNYYFNKENWYKVVAEGKSVSLYAFWIDEGNISLTFELGDLGLSFTDEYKSELGINHNCPRFVGVVSEVIENLPYDTHLDIPQNFRFDGWYFNKELTINFHVANLAMLMHSTADIRLFPKLNRLVNHEFGVAIYVSEEAVNRVFGTPYSKKYFYKENSYFTPNPLYNEQIGFGFYYDDFNVVLNFLNLILTEDIIVKSEEVKNTEFAGWKFYKKNGYGEPSTTCDFNEENWNYWLEDGPDQIYIIATWNTPSEI